MNYEVGKYYRYSELPKESEYVTVLDHGEELIGTNAIHVRIDRGDETTIPILDIWFIYDGQGNEGIFKCVYKK